MSSVGERLVLKNLVGLVEVVASCLLTLARKDLTVRVIGFFELMAIVHVIQSLVKIMGLQATTSV